MATTTPTKGTPYALSGREGELLWRADYSAWGQARTQRTAAGVAEQIDVLHRYPGQWYDEETGLHYNRFRYYDPHMARYVSRDPIGFEGGLNHMAYVGNPNQWIDPLGLQQTLMDPLYKLVHDSTGYEPSDTTVNAAAGFGDSITFGGTNYIRKKLGVNDNINKCSVAYNSAEFAGGMLIPIGRIGYVAKAVSIPHQAKTAEQAYKMRNALKISYRKGWPEPWKSKWHITSFEKLAEKRFLLR